MADYVEQQLKQIRDALAIAETAARNLEKALPSAPKATPEDDRLRSFLLEIRDIYRQTHVVFPEEGHKPAGE